MLFSGLYAHWWCYPDRQRDTDRPRLIGRLFEFGGRLDSLVEEFEGPFISTLFHYRGSPVDLPSHGV